MDAGTMAALGARLHAGETLRQDDLDAFADDAFGSGTLGIVWDELSLNRAVAHVEPDERHHQPYGIVHGGVWCSIVESLASVGAALQVASDGRFVVGVSNSTDFLRAHRTGRIEAVAEPIHVGRTQQLWQVVLSRTDDGKAVARGQVRLQNVDPAALGSD
jgi:1,4-dihydroxy-2-naphthoyl-CoA hydrolase